MSVVFSDACVMERIIAMNIAIYSFVIIYGSISAIVLSSLTFLCISVTTAQQWDERHVLWDYKELVEHDSDESDISEDEDGSDDEDIFGPVRRSRRLSEKKKQRSRRGGRGSRSQVAV